MFDYKQLEALATVVREGSFLKASQKLRLTQPAISERIRLLEEFMGQPTLIRSAPVRPTEAGQRLLHHFEQVQVLEYGLHGRPGVRIPIGVNFDSLSSWFIPAVTKDVIKHRLSIELVSANENRTLDLLREGRVLACVSSESKPVSGCSVAYLGSLIYRCVSSPQLLKSLNINLKQMTKKEVLSQLPAIIYDQNDEFHNEFFKGQFGKDAERPTYLYVPFSFAMKEAVLKGWGYALVLYLNVFEEIEKGELIDLMPGKTLEVKLYWHSVQISNSLLHEMSDHIVNFAKKTLEQMSRRGL